VVSSVVVLASVAAGAFGSTNVDAFVMLVANSVRAPASRRAAAAGFLAATALVLTAALGFAAASRLVPPTKAGLVGLVPLGMGLKQGYDAIRKRVARARARAAAGDDEPPKSTPRRDTLGFGEALALHLSMSLDNLAVYAALLADTMPALRPVVVLTTLALALVLAAAAHLAAQWPTLSRIMLRSGHGVMAVLLVGVGVYILADTETDVLPGPGEHAAGRETR
jgi:cadmium resistance protein CadD (predicted permease)